MNRYAFLSLISIILTLSPFCRASSPTEVEVEGLALNGWPQCDVATDGSPVWDFSSMSVKSRMTGRFITFGDSILMEHLPDIRLDFVRADGIYPRIVLAEGRNWRVWIDSLPAGKQGERADSAIMSVDLSLSMAAYGKSTQIFEHNQTVVCQPGDTVRSASLLRIGFEGKLKTISEDSYDTPVSVERCYWTVAGEQYPLAVATIVDHKPMSVYLFDRQNNANHSIVSGSLATDPVRVTTLSGWTSEAARSDILSQHGDSTPPTIGNENLRYSQQPIIETSPGSLTVTLDREDPVDTNFSLCDISGRTIPISNKDGLTVSYTGLAAGDYILSVFFAGGNISYKIYIPHHK